MKTQEKHQFDYIRCKFHEVPPKHWFLLGDKLYYKEFYQTYNALGYNEDWVTISMNAQVDWVKKIENPYAREGAQRRVNKILGAIK